MERWNGYTVRQASERLALLMQPGVGSMQTIGIVLNVGNDHVAAFEEGFRQMELPIWQDLNARGALTMATLTKLDISTRKVEGATQYLVAAIFATDEGHHLHDQDPRFEAWNTRADAYQIAEPFVFGGDTIINVDPRQIARAE